MPRRAAPRRFATPIAQGFKEQNRVARVRWRDPGHVDERRRLQGSGADCCCMSDTATGAVNECEKAMTCMSK
ncbi:MULTISPECIES: hypothetical protein [Mesorhizobium]|uniref:hypothetical protein n=1 Tax=Mesorhizobium TaxID=68287 RepID=UPI0013159E1A|nr:MULTISPECIES: hypothetical protein [Mesorhizobium]